MRKIVRLIFLLLIIFVALFSGCRDNSLEAQLERANSEANSANEAYQDAQDRIDRLTELQEEYDIMQVRINNLEIGTMEYNQAIEENNRLVKLILKEFPELEPYVQTY